MEVVDTLVIDVSRTSGEAYVVKDWSPVFANPRPNLSLLKEIIQEEWRSSSYTIEKWGYIFKACKSNH